MNGENIFIDTNILIYLLQGNEKVARIINHKHLVISFITEQEFSSYPSQNKEEEKSIQRLLKDCFIIDINPEIKFRTIALRHINKIKLPDAIICATSIFIDLPILTADKKLASVDGLNVVLLELN